MGYRLLRRVHPRIVHKFIIRKFESSALREMHCTLSEAASEPSRIQHLLIFVVCGNQTDKSWSCPSNLKTFWETTKTRDLFVWPIRPPKPPSFVGVELRSKVGFEVLGLQIFQICWSLQGWSCKPKALNPKPALKPQTPCSQNLLFQTLEPQPL